MWQGCLLLYFTAYSAATSPLPWACDPTFEEPSLSSSSEGLALLALLPLPAGLSAAAQGLVQTMMHPTR